MKRVLAVLFVAATLILFTSIVWALPGPATIDGNPADWADATCLVDSGGADDETSPARSDITEFCAHVDAQYIYVMMAWDNTAFTGGTASTAGSRLDVDADGLFDYIILATLGNPLLQGYSIGLCDAGGACTNSDGVCSSTGGATPCTGTQAMAGVLWVDPFGSTGRTAGDCGGTSCLTNDAFVEMAIPWSLLGLPGPPSPHVFGDFSSYPSGPAQAPKDTVADGAGISCDANGTCWVSTPTAVTLSDLDLSARDALALPAIAGLLFLAVATALALVRRGYRNAT